MVPFHSLLLFIITDLVGQDTGYFAPNLRVTRHLLLHRLKLHRPASTSVADMVRSRLLFMRQLVLTNFL
jgi:hypothetical protein